MMVKAMTSKKFPRIDGKEIPAKLWKGFIPDKPNKITDQKLQEGEQILKSVAKSPIDGNKTVLPRTYRYKIRKFLGKDNRVEIPGESTKEADRKAAARAQMQTAGYFHEKSDFPIWERFGLKTLDEFMDAWEWRFEPKTKSSFEAFSHEGSREPSPATRWRRRRSPYSTDSCTIRIRTSVSTPFARPRHSARRRTPCCVHTSAMLTPTRGSRSPSR